MEEAKLVGIITAGDLRRALLKYPHMLEKPVSEFMTCRPVTIDVETNLVEAEAFMFERKVLALVVVEGESLLVCGDVKIFD